jgi:hybrid cluster-associated redox disulfide protein
MKRTEAESIAADTTIADLVTRHPAAAQVFIRRRMHCVGCDVDRFHTVADACRIYGQPLASFVADLREVARTSRAPADTRRNHHVAS